MRTVAWAGRDEAVGGAGAHARHARLLATAEVLSPHLNGPSSYRLAQAAEGNIETSAPSASTDDEDEQWLDQGSSQVSSSRVEYWLRELDRLATVGIRMVDQLDDEYPANLRMIHNRPPFLMVRGALISADVRAMAVVGTREPSPEGRVAAHEISRELAVRGVTVVSGLARGIDTAAHEGALEGGGRTIAVFGTGIEKIYPAENSRLASRVEASGACVSQFWPSMGGARWTFPARNLVTSGLSIGTVVVEAGETSGARLQAEAALRHGKRVLLMRDLVRAQQWAVDAAAKPGVTVVDSVDQVIDALEVEVQFDSLAMM